MVKVFWKAAAVAAILTALLFLGWRQVSSEGCPDCNVILISVDALRADHLGVYGYGRGTSPNIDAFARESVVFDNAVTPRPKTNPSVASMLSGIYPYRHGVREHSVPIADKTPLLQEWLRDGGWHTAAFVSNWVLQPGLGGFQRGFDVYDYDFTRQEMNRRDVGERDAAETNDAVYKWLDGRSVGKFFLWIHYIDPHGPYYPPEGYRGLYTHAEPSWVKVGMLPPYQILPDAPRSGDATDAAYYIDQYDGEVRYVDHEFGRLIASLRERGLLEKTLVILTSDHGEGLGEHAYYFEHGGEVYEDNSKVPLIVRYPDGRVAGTRVRELVSLMDVPPTVTAYLGLGWRGAASPDGRDWAPALYGAAVHDDVFIERKEGPVFQRAAVRTRTMKFLAKDLCNPADSEGGACEGARYECYDLSHDPLELDSEGCGAEKEALRKRLMERLASAWRDGLTLPVGTMTEKDSGILKSLGYMN